MMGRGRLGRRRFGRDRGAVAVAERLAQPNGPEAVIVTSSSPSPWLDDGPVRERCRLVFADLLRSDLYDRCRIYHAVTSGGAPMAIDSRVTVVDDVLLRVGSADLTNRAMGIDSQCDVAVEAIGNDSVARGIVRFRDDLIAEHLGRTADEIAEARQEIGGGGARGMVGAIERLGCATATLVRVDPRHIDAVASGRLASVEGPAQPRAPQALIEERLPDAPGESRALTAYGRGFAFVLLLAAAVLAWNRIEPFLPLAGKTFGTQAMVGLALLATTAAFTLPPVAVAGAVGIVLDSWAGFGLLAAVCLTRAWGTHTLGRMLGREGVRRVAVRRLNRLSRRLGSGAFWEVVEAHWLGAAPYSLVNLVSGASGTPLGVHLRATLAAIAPRILAAAILGSQVAATIRSPGVAELAQAGSVVAALISLDALVRRRLAHAR